MIKLTSEIVRPRRVPKVEYETVHDKFDGIWITSIHISGDPKNTRAVIDLAPYSSENGSVLRGRTTKLCINDVMSLAGEDQSVGVAMQGLIQAIGGLAARFGVIDGNTPRVIEVDPLVIETEAPEADPTPEDPAPEGDPDPPA
jgi:hypothetical protein